MMLKTMIKNTLKIIILAAVLSQLAFADSTYRTRSSDNIDRIVRSLYSDSSLPKSQIMVAILAKNPEAFKDGNINFLLRDKRLILPDDDEIARISPDDARELLIQHNFFFREGVTGDELLLTPVFLEKKQKAESRQLSADKDQQTKKISRLEQERAALKQQLEALFAEKKERDQKLIELEASIQNSLSSSKNATSTTNQALAQNAKVPTSTNLLTHQSDQEVKESEHEVTTTSISTELDKTSQMPSNNRTMSESSRAIATTPLNNQKADSSPAPQQGVIPSKITWLLLITLLALGWFLIKRLLARRTLRDDDIDFSEQIKQAQSTDFLMESDTQNDAGEVDYELKYEVALSYIEAGDLETAQPLLDEILANGNRHQQSKVQQVLDALKKA